MFFKISKMKLSRKECMNELDPSVILFILQDDLSKQICLRCYIYDFKSDTSSKSQMNESIRFLCSLKAFGFPFCSFLLLLLFLFLEGSCSI